MKRNKIRLENNDLLCIGSVDYIQSVRYDFRDQGFEEKRFVDHAVGLLITTDRLIKCLGKTETMEILTKNFAKEFDLGYTLIDYSRFDPTIVGEYRPEVSGEDEDPYI